MKPGTIPRLLDYYFTNEEFAEEIKRALDYFFGKRKNREKLEIDENMEGHFNEWLVYDFALKNGKNLLRDFYDRNPCGLAEDDLKIYKDLQNNEYAMFEVLKVEKGKGLELLSLQSGKKYFADEFMGTFQIAKGNIFPGRAGKVGDHWELIGTNSLLLKIKIDKKMKDHFLASKDKITPKTVYDIFLSQEKSANENDGIDFQNKEKLDLGEIEKQLKEKLEYLNIGEYVSVDLIRSWISDLNWKRNESIPSIIFSMLLGLTREDRRKNDIDELIFLVGSFYNLTPQKNLGNKSPDEMSKKKSSGKKGARVSMTTLNSNEWIEYFEKASEFMHNNKNKKALENYDKCFEALLKNKTVNSEIYRLFANKAIAHFSLGEEKKGIKLLKIALDLNPNYDFGRDVMEMYEDGEYDNLILCGSLERMAENAKNGKSRKRAKKIENDPAIIYFNYLKKFNINFATKELTVSDRTIIGPDSKFKKIKGERKKIGRNDLCPCGSGRKYKKCCMGK